MGSHPLTGQVLPNSGLIPYLFGLHLKSRPPQLDEESTMSDILRQLDSERVRDDLPDFAPGDTIKVLYKVREGQKERIQAFEGVCIARRGGGMGETFTVRKLSGGIGVERVFPFNAPTVGGVEVVRRGRVRRAKLYYLRGLRGKAARIREKRTARPN